MRWVERGFLEGLQFFKNFEKIAILKNLYHTFKKQWNLLKFVKNMSCQWLGACFQLQKNNTILCKYPIQFHWKWCKSNETNLCKIWFQSFSNFEKHLYLEKPIPQFKKNNDYKKSRPANGWGNVFCWLQTIHSCGTTPKDFVENNENLKELMQIDIKKTQLCNRTPHTHT